MDVYELAKQVYPGVDFGGYTKQRAEGEAYSVKVGGETVRLKKYSQGGRYIFLGISREQRLLVYRKGARVGV